MSTAIEFQGVSKYFKIDRDSPRAFQELFISLTSLTSLTRRKRRPASVFWALRDVSFSIQPGETVGLVGSNGAGKSTALKLISRIIQPSSGAVEANGRVTALLELGAGFHPELSGRDNIQLNGAVMGLTRKEVDRRIDAIIEFAELDDFIDVPVKDYSSGMYARLGFSVAVHLDPQILLVDEALSVGDQAFQQKCSEHMLKLRRSGITILFVSHSLEAIQRICARVIWLDRGRLRMDGATPRVVEAYYKHVLDHSTTRAVATPTPDGDNRFGSGEARVTRVELCRGDGHPERFFQTNDSMMVRIHYRAEQRIEHPLFGLGFHHADSGVHLAGPNNAFADYDIPFIEGVGVVEYVLPSLPFLPGDYRLTTAIYGADDGRQYDTWVDCACMSVAPGGTRERYGLIALEGAWRHLRASDGGSDGTVAHPHPHDRVSEVSELLAPDAVHST
jgi:lipopolysaccharide transport system ATP-binding protein